MKLATFEENGRIRVGAVSDDETEIVDLTAAGLPETIVALLAQGEQALAAARQAFDARKKVFALNRVRLRAPIPRPPRNVLCVGKNYTEHAKEFQDSGFDAANPQASEIPERPIIFTKATTSVIGPGDTIPAHLDPTTSTDYEGELAVIIGTGGRSISRDNAMAHVYGYTILNDVTARNIQRDHKQWFLGKSIDGFCPMGPWLVTADEIGDIREVMLTTEVNGERRQHASISQLIFDIPTLIETLSRGMTLEVGDIIATGTPVGVGIGFDPPKFLSAGDTVAITVDRIGRLENPVG